MNHDIPPCKLCGEPVRLEQVKEAQGFGGATYVEVRRCDNPDCPSSDPNWLRPDLV